MFSHMASNTYTCLAEVALHCIPLHYPACQRNSIPRVRGEPHTASTVCYCWHPELARLPQLNSSSERFPAQCSLSRLWHWERVEHAQETEGNNAPSRAGIDWLGREHPTGKYKGERKFYKEKKDFSRIRFAVSEVWGETGRKTWI